MKWIFWRRARFGFSNFFLVYRIRIHQFFFLAPDLKPNEYRYRYIFMPNQWNNNFKSVWIVYKATGTWKIEERISVVDPTRIRSERRSFGGSGYGERHPGPADPDPNPSVFQPSESELKFFLKISMYCPKFWSLTPMALTRKIKLALLWMKVNFSFWFSNMWKLRIGSGSA